MDFKNALGSSERKPSAAAAAAAPLARQGSVYSLTFDEFQSTLGGMASGLGKDFGSMNMDELLRSIWTAEESQAMASASVSASAAGAGANAAQPLQRQGSLTLPRTLSVKTVDEVWRDLVRDEPTQDAAGASAGPELQQRRQPTLGEMTLEEFLVRAGVVRENPCPSQSLAPRPMPIGASAGGNSAGSNALFYGNFANSNDAGAGALGFASLPLGGDARVGIGNPTMGNGLMPGSVGMGGGSVVQVAVAESAVNQIEGTRTGNGDMSSPMQPVPYTVEGVLRGRRSGGSVEKVVERRQRRMIKNRESAARSRARKQAYTMELEAEVAKLKEQNMELQKKQAEMMETQKNQVLEMINNPHGQKKRCLRRTLTGPW